MDTDESLDAVEALERLGGIASAAALLRLTTRRKLRSAVDRKEIRRAGHSRYALPAADQARRAATYCKGVATHLSAATVWGWELRAMPRRPQVAVPRHLPLPKTEAAEVRRLDRSAAVEGWATDPVWTVLLCARDLPFADALTVADSALRHRSVTQDELFEAARKIRGELGARVRRVLDYADGRAANPFESTLRALAIESGLHVIPQYEIRAGDLVVHPDLVDPVNGVVLEAESWEFHGKEKAAFESDCERYNALVVTGWRVLRFTWTQVMLQPDYVRGCLRELYAELAA